jgi:hypothetical protein
VSSLESFRIALLRLGLARDTARYVKYPKLLELADGDAGASLVDAIRESLEVEIVLYLTRRGRCHNHPAVARGQFDVPRTASHVAHSLDQRPLRQPSLHLHVVPVVLAPGVLDSAIEWRGNGVPASKSAWGRVHLNAVADEAVAGTASGLTGIGDIGKASDEGCEPGEGTTPKTHGVTGVRDASEGRLYGFSTQKGWAGRCLCS